MITINNEDYDYALVLPISEHYALDESLDNAVIRIDGIERATRFEPYTIATITKGTDTYDYYIAKDTVKKVVGNNLYNHTIALIELTKITEKYIIDTNTVTQPKYHDYAGLPAYVTETYRNETVGFYSLLEYKGFYQPGSQITLVSALNYQWQNVSGITYDCNLKVTHGGTTTTYGDIATPTITIESGSYEIEYSGYDTLGLTNKATATFTINAINQPNITNKTITSVVNKLCELTKESRFNSIKKRDFVFNDAQATEYENEIAPEFSFTKCTLWEALSQVGGYIHAIPRIELGNNVFIVYFDKLGQNEQAEINGDLIGESEEQDIEQYCTEIDTNIDNLVNTDDIYSGTITEPYANGLETVRVEEGTIQIKDDNAIIETEYPIMAVAKLEVGYLDDGTFVGDITDYVYEQAEYLALSSTSGSSATKAYAIYYTQGQKGIKGLSFTLPNAISSLFEHKSIINIISAKLGRDIENLFTTYGITKLNFRLTYFPITSARIKATKTNMLEFKTNTTSIYNQSANVVDSDAYGENLKGAVARLGNIEKSKTYIIPSIEDLNDIKVGQKHEDYYISAITQEIYKDYAKATLYLSKDFNRLNQYIGIKQNLRMYEVSEKQSVDRFNTWNEYCIISLENPVVLPQEDTIIDKNGFMEVLLADFNSALYQFPKITVARFKGYNSVIINDNETLQAVQPYYVDLPVITMGVGNTIYLGFKMHDNYSAGNKSEESFNQQSTTPTSNTYYRVQDYVPYNDYFGEFEYMEVKFLTKITDIDSYQKALDWGNSLPQEYDSLQVDGWTYIDTTAQNPIKVLKDNRECLNFSYQLHFIKGRGEYLSEKYDIVVGSAIASKSKIVTDAVNQGCEVYSSTEYIDKFAKVIDVANMTPITDTIQTQQYIDTAKARLRVENVPATTKSLVFVRKDTKELVFAVNKEQFSDTTDVYLTITHNIEYYK